MIKRNFFGENGTYIDDGEPVYLSSRVIGGTPKFHFTPEKDIDSVSVFDNKNSSISKMLKDRKMTKMIRDGKGSDKGIKREALAIEKENMAKPKERWMSNKLKKIDDIKKEFKLGPYARRD